MSKKIVILVLVVIGVVAFMAIGAGTYRDHRKGGDTQRYDSAAVRLIDDAIGWMRSDFDVQRLSGCGAPSLPLAFAGTCRLIVGPGSSSRPSSFTLKKNGSVRLCFGLTRTSLEECVNGNKLQALDNDAEFTVAGDSAFLELRCMSQSSCVVGVTRD